VVEAAPAQASARRLLVTTYLRMQQAGKARDALLPGLLQEPVDPRLLPLAGEVFFRNGELARAEEFFSKARLKTPAHGKLRTSLALLGMAQHPSPGGLAALRDISASDDGASADMALVSALMQRQDYEAALKAIAGLEKKQPKQPLASYLRSRVQLATKQRDAARASLQQALTLDANYYPAVAGLAALELADQKPQEARKQIDTFLQKNPRHAQALLALADLAARSGAPVPAHRHGAKR
jgi:predicted Zn-dependent protease